MRVGLLGSICASLLASGCVTGRASDLTLPQRPAGQAPTAADGPVIVDNAMLGVSVRALSREVEAIRALRFQREVPFRVLSVAAIAAHFRDERGVESEAQKGDDLLAVGLGHLRDEDGNDRDEFAQMMGNEAQGFYDPRDGILTLSEVEARSLSRAGPAGIEARATVVHELVHALQDQHFHGRVAVDDTAPAMTDRASVRLALLEGDATLVTLEWQARQRGARMLGTSDQRPRIERWAERAQVLTEANVPKYFIDAIELPYEAGATAVGALYERGGWSAVNAALARDELRTGAMLHPERGDDGLVVVEPAPPRPGAERVLQRELGELELRLLLAAIVRKERAGELASTWRGDSVALDRAMGVGARAPLVLQWRIACGDVQGADALVLALAPLIERWRRDGCPRMRGGSAGACPASVTVEQGPAGVTVLVRRGD
jgi:hypothetical protein